MEGKEEKVYRMLRVLEYVGSQAFIEQHWRNRAVKGISPTGYNAHKPISGVIREAVIGEIPEILVGDYESMVDPANDLGKAKNALYNISEEVLELQRLTLVDGSATSLRHINDALNKIREHLAKVGL